MEALENKTSGLLSSAWGAGQYLSFHSMQTAFAIPIDRVREIIEYGQITTVPLMPEYVKGVINLRGNVVPVIDLGCRFSGEKTNIGKRTCIIIMELPIGDTIQQAGLIVDAVDEVMDIESKQIEPPPEFGAGINTKFILGMARQEKGFLIIMKAEALFTEEELQRMYGARPIEVPEV